MGSWHHMTLFLCIVSAPSSAPPQHVVDYQQVFASLTQQFEAQCQLAKKMEAMPSDKEENMSLNNKKEDVSLPNERKKETSSVDNRKEVISLLNSRKRLISSLNSGNQGMSSLADNKPSSLAGWSKLNKDHQKQHGTGSEKSSDGVPVLKKIRIDFTWDSDTTSPSTEPHSLWFVPKTNKRMTANESVTEDDTAAMSDWLLTSSTSPVTVDVAELFNLITNSDTSSWLLSPTPQTMDTSSGLSLWVHPPPSHESEGVAEVVNSIAETSMSSWLLGSPKQQDDSNVLHPSSSSGSDQQIAEVQSNANDQWLMPRCKYLVNVLCQLFIIL